MNFWVVGPLLVVLVVLWWRKASIVVWAIAWWGTIFIFLKFAFRAPIPESVLWLYMGIVSGAILLYVSADSERLRAFSRPLLNFATKPQYSIPRILVLLGIPGLVGASVYMRVTQPVEPPFFARTVHPANPDKITVHDKEFDLITLQNPFRSLEQSDPEEFRRRVEMGREVYYHNCFYCHGDNTTGNGLFQYGLNPLPTNLKENIALLQESFLFWRIAKGGPGLPDEGGPWETAMPVWEKFLSEDEIWEVVLFLYDFTDQRPRAREEVSGE